VVREIKIFVPDPIFERLEAIERRYRITKQDIILRTLVKVIEEFER